jgi:poly(ADP-ribose) glycohydrolase ARH3
LTDEGSKDALKERFRGALLGTMVGDALGMPVEGMSASVIRARYDLVTEMLPARLGKGTYTDDTEMMIGLAEALLDTPGRLDVDQTAVRFGENYDPDRGYGGNAQMILSAIREGIPWRDAVKANSLPGGSYANGAAMRVAPVSLAFYRDAKATVQAAANQAEITGHTHPIGRIGACLQAIAVRWAIMRGSQGANFNAQSFLTNLKLSEPKEFVDALAWIAGNLAASPDEAEQHLGTGGQASCSVPAALWSVLSCPQDPEEAIIRAVNLGGDTDTIGAMAGAVAGAYHGAEALPQRWTRVLEEGDKGKAYVIELADRLLELATSE